MQSIKFQFARVYLFQKYLFPYKSHRSMYVILYKWNIHEINT